MDSIIHSFIKEQDKIHINREDLHTIFKWTTAEMIKSCGGMIQETEVNNVKHLAYKIEDIETIYSFLSFYLYEKKPFNTVTFAIADTSEIQFEYDAMMDIQQANGRRAQFKQDNTDRFIGNIANHIISFDDKYVMLKKLKMTSIPIGTEKKQAVEEALIRYYNQRKSKAVVLDIPIYYFYVTVDFEQEKMFLYGENAIYRGDIVEDIPAVKLYNQFAVHSGDTKLFAEITFKEALEIAVQPDSVYKKQQKVAKLNVNKDTIGYVASFMQDELFCRVVYFFQYMELTNAVERIVEKRKVVKNANHSKSKNKRKKSLSFTTIETVKYHYIMPNELVEERREHVENSIKRQFQFIKEKWTVRGHWRTYKNGRKVWVSPQIRKRKNISDDVNMNIEPKHYVVKSTIE